MVFSLCKFSILLHDTLVLKQNFHDVWYFLFTVSGELDVVSVVDQLDSMSNAHKVQSTVNYIIIGKLALNLLEE